MTAGEQLTGRVLRKETRAGVEHYVPGQHEAEIWRNVEYPDVGVDVGRLTYVDGMGHACVVVAIRDPAGEWYVVGCRRAGILTDEPARPPVRGFVLSPDMLAALDSAKDAIGSLP